jgi:hypothetical protein
MAVLVVSGKKFEGVEYGTVPGDGYIIGTTPVNNLPMLFVDETEENKRASLYGLKYYHHAKGDTAGAERPPDKQHHSFTMLVSEGKWKQKVWSESGESIEVVLWRPGDFIAWIPGLWHSWFPEETSTMLTIKWTKLRS